MTILIILAIYALGVLFCRWLNYILVRNDDSNPIAWGLWFIPIFGPFLFILLWLILMGFKDVSKKYTFFGKNWKS